MHPFTFTPNNLHPTPPCTLHPTLCTLHPTPPTHLLLQDEYRVLLAALPAPGPGPLPGSMLLQGFVELQVGRWGVVGFGPIPGSSLLLQGIVELQVWGEGCV